MIELHRTPSCTQCDAIEATLQELVLAHRVVYVDEGTPAPVLTEGRHTYATPEAIQRFLAALRAELTFSRELSGDACYIDPDGDGACL